MSSHLNLASLINHHGWSLTISNTIHRRLNQELTSLELKELENPEAHQRTKDPGKESTGIWDHIGSGGTGTLWLGQLDQISDHMGMESQIGRPKTFNNLMQISRFDLDLPDAQVAKNALGLDSVYTYRIISRPCTSKQKHTFTEGVIFALRTRPQKAFDRSSDGYSHRQHDQVRFHPSCQTTDDA